MKEHVSWNIPVTIHFFTSDSPTGSGKTYRATTLACERIRGVKTAVIQPTIALCRQSYRDACHRFPQASSQIDVITSDRSTDDSIAHRITDYLKDRDQAGNLLHLTHAGSSGPRIGIARTLGRW